MSTYRIELEIGPTARLMLDDLKEQCGLKDDQAVIWEAMWLFQWMVEQSRKGHYIASIEPDQRRQHVICLEALERVRRKAEPRMS